MAPVVSPQEFEQLYRDTARDVVAYVRRRTAGSGVDAEDLVAEAYAVAWRRRLDLPPPLLRRAWLFGVARRLLEADVRRRRRAGELSRELAVTAPDAGAAGERADDRADDRRARIVTAALERLGPGDREVLRLVGWEGLTPAELAVALGVRPGTARVRLHRARRALAADPEVRALVERHPGLPVRGMCTVPGAD